jgi:two-component system sensor histidine kinase/response regulator
MNPTSPAFLYIEDDAMSRRIIDVMLRQVMGFSNTTIFDNSADFLEKVHALPAVPDVIFLDVQIRPHDGYAVLKLLREDSSYRDVPVIAMTANVMSHDVEHLKKAGFSGLIGKPILKEIFPQLVKNILNGEAVWYVP